jgi:O-antigen/teichoic acid export membrane protein
MNDPGARVTSDRDEVIPASGERFSTAVAWSFVMNSAQTFATLGTAFLLAGLLGPEAYGTVALALIFIMLLEVLTQQGLGPALIQRPDLTSRHLDSAFWLAVSVSVLLMTAGLLLSDWWAGLNGSPEAAPVIRALSVLVIIRGLTVVQEALLERQLAYRALALRTTTASVAGAIAGITFALVQRSMWALVVQQLVTAVVGVAVLWSIATWRPRFRFAASEAREMLAFAARASLSSVAMFVSIRVDALLVGVFFGATAVGLYRLADRVVQSAVELSARPVQRVGLPEFSRQQGVVGGPRERYLSLVSASTAMGAAFMAILFACSAPLMEAVGPEWVPATGALRMLCIMGALQVMTMLNGAAIVGAGHPGLHAAMMWISAILSAGAFATAGYLLADSSLATQVVGMAASRAILWVVVLVPLSQTWLISRYVDVRFGEFLRVVAPLLAVSSGIALLGAGLARVLASTGIPSLATVAIVGAVTTAAIVPLNLRSSPSALAVARRVFARRSGPGGL